MSKKCTITKNVTINNLQDYVNAVEINLDNYLKYIPIELSKEDLLNSEILEFRDIKAETFSAGGSKIHAYLLLKTLNNNYIILCSIDNPCIGDLSIFNNFEDAIKEFNYLVRLALEQGEDYEDLWEVDKISELIDVYKSIYCISDIGLDRGNIAYQTSVIKALQTLVDNKIKYSIINKDVVDIVRGILNNSKGDSPDLDKISKIEVDWPKFIEEWDYFLDVGEFYSITYKDGKKFWIFMDFENTYIISPEKVDEIIKDLKECFKEDMDIQLARDIEQL